jgi:hypothetical protein
LLHGKKIHEAGVVMIEDKIPQRAYKMPPSHCGGPMDQVGELLGDKCHIGKFKEDVKGEGLCEGFVYNRPKRQRWEKSRGGKNNNSFAIKLFSFL